MEAGSGWKRPWEDDGEGYLPPPADDAFWLPPLAEAFGSSPPSSPAGLGPARAQHPPAHGPDELPDGSDRPQAKRQRLHEARRPSDADAELFPSYGTRPPGARSSAAARSTQAAASSFSAQPQAARLVTPAQQHASGQVGRHHPPRCTCTECTSIQTTLSSIVIEAQVLEAYLVSTLTGRSPSSNTFPNIAQAGIGATLELVFGLLRSNNALLQEASTKSVVHPQESRPPEALDPSPYPASAEAMKRAQEMQNPSPPDPSRRPPPYQQDSSSRTRSVPPPLEEVWRAQQSIEPHPASYSPHRTASAASSVYMPMQSPGQPPSMRVLPSPTSLNFPAPPPSIHSYNPQTPLEPPTAAHAAHLQNLQHQVSVKTLALQTLQREYDSLLQKLERQRTKSMALEKKFEVSDVEINTLTDEKEKLQAQVAAFEAQLAELAESRDEARRQVSTSGSQYMKIMESASRLQAQGQEDKRRWEREKELLENRIKILEGGPSDPSVTDVADAGGCEPQCTTTESMEGIDPLVFSTAAASSSAPDPNLQALRAEIIQLRARNQALENALRTLRNESRVMQEVAQGVAGLGERIQSAIDKALEPS